MSPPKQLKLAAFMHPVSIHTGAWRYLGAIPDANFDFGALQQLIQKREQGKFDALCMTEHLAVLTLPINPLKRGHTVTSFESFTLLSARATCSEHIRLIGSASTTYDTRKKMTWEVFPGWTWYLSHRPRDGSQSSASAKRHRAPSRFRSGNDPR